MPDHAEGAHKAYYGRIQRKYADDESLRLAAGQVEALLAHPGWTVLTELVNEAHADRQRDLIFGHAAMKNGAVPSQADYARVCGFLAGVEQPQIAAEAFPLAVKAMQARNADPS